MFVNINLNYNWNYRNKKMVAAMSYKIVNKSILDIPVIKYI